MDNHDKDHSGSHGSTRSGTENKDVLYPCESVLICGCELDERGWPVGFFEQLAGSWEGEFVQENEGELDLPPEF
jgi:hypothetical protein